MRKDRVPLRIVAMFTVFGSIFLMGFYSDVRAQLEENENGDSNIVIIEEEDVEDDEIEEETENLDTSEGEETQSVEGLISIEATIGVQSVLTNKIPLTVVVTPRVSSSRAEITWYVPRELEAQGETEKWFSMEDGVTNTFGLDVIPEESGRYEVVVDVTAWRHDTNYVTSAELVFEIDDELHVTPAPDQYKMNMMLYQVGVVAGIILGLVALGMGIKFGIARFKKWMAED